MKWREFIGLNYHPELEVEDVLTDALYNGHIDVNTVIVSYTKALERERTKQSLRFNEACINLTQMLGTNFKGDAKKDVIKRAIHTFNLNRSLVPHVHDAQHGYTQDDERKWDEFCEMMYGSDFNVR